MEKLILNKEIELDGKKVKEIEYDLDNLTGATYEEAIKEMQLNQQMPMQIEFDSSLHAHIFAKAADIDYNDVKRFSILDFVNATSKVRDFFLVNLAISQLKNTSEQ